jgi:hypothetical protein
MPDLQVAFGAHNTCCLHLVSSNTTLHVTCAANLLSGRLGEQQLVHAGGVGGRTLTLTVQVPEV